MSAVSLFLKKASPLYHVADTMWPGDGAIISTAPNGVHSKERVAAKLLHIRQQY